MKPEGIAPTESIANGLLAWEVLNVNVPAATTADLTFTRAVMIKDIFVNINSPTGNDLIIRFDNNAGALNANTSPRVTGGLSAGSYGLLTFFASNTYREIYKVCNSMQVTNGSGANVLRFVIVFRYLESATR